MSADAYPMQFAPRLRVRAIADPRPRRSGGPRNHARRFAPIFGVRRSALVTRARTIRAKARSSAPIKPHAQSLARASNPR